MASVSNENYNPEDYLLNTLNDLDIGFVKISNAGNILNHNLSYNKIFGYNPENNLIGTKIFDYWLNIEEKNNFRRALYNEGIVKKYISPAKKLDGEKIMLQINIKLNKNSNGDVISSEGTFVDITEHLRTEQELKESEERFRRIIENAPFGYYRVGKNGLWQYVNPVWERMHDYSLQEIIGKSFEITQPENAKEQARIYVQRVLSGETITGEFGRAKKDGTLEYHTFNIQPIYQKGEIIAIEGFINDITDLKETEQRLIVSENNLRELNNELEQLVEERTKELKESEEILKSTIESTADGILVVDENGQVKHTNSKFSDMWRIPQDLIEKREDQKLLDYVLNQLKDPEAFLSKVEQLYLSANDDFDTLYFKDGRVFERFSSPLILEEEIKGRVWSFRDITERKLAEQKLKESEEKYSTLTKLSPVGIFNTDQKGNCLYINERWSQIAGLSLDEALGTGWVDGLYLNDRNRVITEWDNTAENNVPFESEYRFKRPDGKITWVYGQAIAIEDDLGKIVGYVGTITDISKRKLAEKKLKEEKEKAQTFLEVAGVILLVLNADLTVQLINRKGSEILEEDESEIIGKNWIDDYIPENNRELVKKEYNRFINGEIELFEYTEEPILKKNKEKRIIAWHNRELRDAEGKIIGSLSSGQDITERKESEEILKESERKLKEAQSLGKIGYWEFDINSQQITWSDQVYKIYNRDPSLGPPSVEEEGNYYTPEINERLKEYASRAIEFGEDFDYDFQAKLPSGMVVQLTSLMRTINNRSGQVIKLVGTVQDITERKAKEKEIFDLAQFPAEDPYPILRVSRNGVMYINDAGQKLLNLVDSDQIPEIFLESVRNSFESNQISEAEAEFDNRVYTFIITPIKDADYVNIYGMDITERKHVEEDLKEVNKLKSEFLRRASHELKTPLISIKGFSELILSLYADQLDPVIISNLNEINDGCERLQNIINNLLRTSRLESPELKPTLQKEDLSFLIKFCVNELGSLAKIRRQSIKLDIQDKIYANIEKEEIHDVLSNLLSNAIKYTPPLGKIEIKTELKEDSVVVSLNDNGIGFDENQKTKIFQQFGKIERYGQGLDLGIGGTGLGLYISKRIVESHGGKIWMESEGKNKGSSFYFSLPIVK